MFLCASSTSPIWKPTPQHRVERRSRLLEDHRDSVAADVAHLLVGLLEQVLAVEDDLTALDHARSRDKAHDRERGHALATARLADDAQDLAAPNVEVDAGDRADLALAQVERCAQVADVKDARCPACGPLQRPVRSPRARSGRAMAQRRSLRARCQSCQPRRQRDSRGSSASRSPSPRRLKPSTVERQEYARNEDQVRRREELSCARADHRAPLGGGRDRGEADERQRGDLEHGATDAQRPLNDEWRDRSWAATRRRRMLQFESPSARAAVT